MATVLAGHTIFKQVFTTDRKHNRRRVYDNRT